MKVIQATLGRRITAGFGSAVARLCGIFPPILMLSISLTGCAKNQAPEFMPIPAQTGTVGTRFELRIFAYDPDGDVVNYLFNCPTLPDLAQRARIIRIGQEGLFAWTPLAADVGQHQIDFVASDLDLSDLESVPFAIKSMTGPATAPVFRKPLGDGMTLDLSQDDCLDVEIQVEDLDSLEVEIRVENPLPNAVLSSLAPLSALFHFCPTEEQAKQQRFVVRLVADDKDNPPVYLDYTILVYPKERQSCVDSTICLPGQICASTTCILDDCHPQDADGNALFDDRNDCPAGSFCPAAGPDISPSHCAEPCLVQDDCPRTGYACKVWDRKRGCGLEGDQKIGQACESYTECQGMAMCLPWPGGYCAISDCDSVFGLFSGPCPAGAECIPVDDDRFSPKKHFLCLQKCTTNSDCRDSGGYSCRASTNDAGQGTKVCLL